MSIRRTSLLALTLALSIAGCGRASDPNLDQTGAQPDLPERDNALISAINIAEPTGWNGERPAVPQGFTITPLATGLKIPRQMLLLPNGDLLIAEGSGGGAPKIRPKDVIAGLIKARGKSKVKGGDRITLIRDADRDGRPELATTFIGNLDAPYGLALIGNEIFVANQGDLMAFPYTPGQTTVTAPGREVTKLPSELNHHWTKALAASPDGTKLYVGIGSNSNVGERGMAVEQDRAVVWEIDRVTGAHRSFATGLRNPTALAFHPETNVLWTAVNERDELGPQLVPDYITSVREGAFYGWPYSYWGGNVDPRVRPQKPEMVKKAIAPDYALGSHVAALGLTFVGGNGPTASYASGAFVGEHGSWNREDPSGYKVVWVPFTGGRPTGPPRDFVTGFLDADGKARGRPVGVVYDPIARALFIADDLSNTIWRVAPTGTSAPTTAARR